VGTSAGFFLPLDRAVRALRLLQAREPVTRGTLQAVCLHQPFDEARRLGLPAAEEAAFRAQLPDELGLLVFSEVLPKGPALMASDGF
jgi:S1-C subfamily serine protease